MFGNIILRIYNFKLTIQNYYTKKKLNHLKKKFHEFDNMKSLF